MNDTPKYDAERCRKEEFFTAVFQEPVIVEAEWLRNEDVWKATELEGKPVRIARYSRLELPSETV